MHGKLIVNSQHRGCGSVLLFWDQSIVYGYGTRPRLSLEQGLAVHHMYAHPDLQYKGYMWDVIMLT